MAESEIITGEGAQEAGDDSRDSWVVVENPDEEL